VNEVTMSERLGHAPPAFTPSTCGRAVKGLRALAAGQLWAMPAAPQVESKKRAGTRRPAAAQAGGESE
jgi:hypothetical protein